MLELFCQNIFGQQLSQIIYARKCLRRNLKREENKMAPGTTNPVSEYFGKNISLVFVVLDLLPLLRFKNVLSCIFRNIL